MGGDLKKCKLEHQETQRLNQIEYPLGRMIRGRVQYYRF